MTESQYPVEFIDIDLLRPHPKNPRAHSDEQVTQIAASIDEHGFYKNIVVARDNTILAGHGAVRASREKGLRQIPVHRADVMPFSPTALQILVGDNMLAQQASVDSRQLHALLEDAGDLQGLGFTADSLKDDLRRTRSVAEVPDDQRPARLVLNFKDKQARYEFYGKHLIGLAMKEDRLQWDIKMAAQEVADGGK